MKKYFLISIALTAVLLSPSLQPSFAGETEWNTYVKKQQDEWQAHNHQNFQDMMKLQADLKTMPQALRSQVIAENHERQYTEDKEFRDRMHKDLMEKLKQEIATDKKMSPAQKVEVVNFQESKYQARVAYFEKRHLGDRGFYQNVLSNTKLTAVERQEAAQKYHDTQTKELEEYKSRNVKARKTFLDKMASQPPAEPKTT